MYVLSYKTCPPGHCHNSFMATGALGHTHVRLDVVGFQDSKKAQVNTTATSIIIDTNIYIYIYINIYIYILGPTRTTRANFLYRIEKT